MSNSDIDVKNFRRALGKFPTGVTIITTKTADGEKVGVTASSFNSVSIDPPLILWSVDKGAYSADIFEKAEYFAVNVLGKTQVDMSNRFAGRGEDKFNGIACTESEHGSPLFSDCAAQFECKTWNVYEGGDHLIIVGEVLDYRHFEETTPLVFAGGSYAVAMQHPSTVASQSLKVPGESLLGDYLLYLLRLAYTRCSAELYPELLKTHNVVPEEWRVLTLLSDAGQADAESLAKMVGQPTDAFMVTIERMQEKGHVVVQEQIQLTEDGLTMAKTLFQIAKAQEDLMLSELTEQQQKNLRLGLKHVAKLQA